MEYKTESKGKYEISHVLWAQWPFKKKKWLKEIDFTFSVTLTDFLNNRKMLELLAAKMNLYIAHKKILCSNLKHISVAWKYADMCYYFFFLKKDLFMSN